MIIITREKLTKGPYIKYVGGGAEGLCECHEIFVKILFFKLTGFKHKIFKLAIKEI